MRYELLTLGLVLVALALALTANLAPRPDVLYLAAGVAFVAAVVARLFTPPRD